MLKPINLEQDYEIREVGCLGCHIKEIYHNCAEGITPKWCKCPFNHGYVRKQSDPRTRPTSPDPSRKPWIESFKACDKVLMEGIVEGVLPDGTVDVSFVALGGYIHFKQFAPHQLKLSTNVQPGEK